MPINQFLEENVILETVGSKKIVEITIELCVDMFLIIGLLYLALVHTSSPIFMVAKIINAMTTRKTHGEYHLCCVF